jgi:Fe-S-cluster containining protein
MLRDVDIRDIWDGKFYASGDKVRVGCNDCEGCSDCCRTTGDSIVLDPYDLYQLTKGLGRTFTDMIEKEIEIRSVDGMILPNIMEHDEEHPEKEDGCPFLNEAGRCGIHAFRPGFCRLFPVGRYYTGEPERSFRYFVQRNECTKKDSPRYKVKLRDWLGIPQLSKYEQYICRWHYFLKDVSRALQMTDPEKSGQVARYVLEIFYVMPYNTQMDFYAQFDMRLDRVCRELAPLGIRPAAR